MQCASRVNLCRISIRLEYGALSTQQKSLDVSLNTEDVTGSMKFCEISSSTSMWHSQKRVEHVSTAAIRGDDIAPA